MTKFLVYKDASKEVRLINTGDSCPIALLQLGKELPSLITEVGAPMPKSPVFALIICR